MLEYKVMTEQEAIEERFNLLKDGIYDAVVLSSRDTISSNSGNPMMDITLQVFDDQGRSRDVRDFLVFTPKMMWKVIHFAESAGLNEQYLEGKLCSDIAIGKRIKVKIAVEQGGLIPEDKLNNREKGSRYSDKNKVEDYLKIESNKVSNNELEDDDIAF